MSERFALLVATADYTDPELARLPATAQDADALAEVLGDPKTGKYTLAELRNEPSWRAQEAIESFFSDRARSDLLLVYFSCHGIKDKDGRLYFATTNTRRQLLRSTAIPASFLHDVMSASDSRRQVLILDCCFSGAFSRGMQVKSGSAIAAAEIFDGEGRAVLTASDAMQYAFMEGEAVRSVTADNDKASESRGSFFTSSVVSGLKTGEADLNFDGRISVDELFAYVRKHLRDSSKDQTPTKTLFGVKGDLVLAHTEAARRRRGRRKPSALPRTTADALETHCRLIADLFAEGNVIPVLGQETNMCGRSHDATWEPGQMEFPPTDDELAQYLAARSRTEADQGLMAVAYDIEVYLGRGSLQRGLDTVCGADYTPTPLHTFFAGLRQRSLPPVPLIVTANYDRTLEAAFEAAAEPYDLVSLSAKQSRENSLFVHYPHQGEPVAINRPNEYEGFAPAERTIIVKLRGGAVPTASSPHGYVVTLADYLELLKLDRSKLPWQLLGVIRNRHQLLLGHSIRNRELTMLVQNTLGDERQPLSLKSWAVETDAEPAHNAVWRQRDIELLNVDLADYVEALDQQLANQHPSTQSM